MKPARYYIDAAMLRKRGACPGQIELFVRTFGEGRVPIDERNIEKAIHVGLDVTWPAHSLWNKSGLAFRDRFVELWDESLDADFRKDAEVIRGVLERAPAAWAEFDRLYGGES